VSGLGRTRQRLGRRNADEVIRRIAHAEARAVEETGAKLSTGKRRRVVAAIVRARPHRISGVGASAVRRARLQRKLHRMRVVS